MRSVLIACLMLMGAAVAGAAPPQALRPAASRETPELRAWDTRIGELVRAGSLSLRRSEADALLPGRVHERFAQRHGGVPVFGGEIVRQSDAAGAVSVFGAFYEGIGALPTRPGLSAEQAAARLQAMIGRPPVSAAELFVFPRRDGDGYVLAWRMRGWDGARRYAYFLDANTGALVHRINDLPSQTSSQAAVGSGRGVLGDTKKMSAEAWGGVFLASDLLRPAAILTYTLAGDAGRALDFLNGDARLTANDIARDSDNDWQDPAVVDAHTHTGWTYDYYFKRLGRRGLDDANGSIFPLVHLARREDAERQDAEDAFYTNAQYVGNGIFYVGEGLPSHLRLASTGQRVDYLAGAVDIVAHELTHGVIEYSSGLIYEGESGALDEAFADMMGTAVEFFFQEPGSGPRQADYLLGEDAFTPGGIRSLANPTVWRDPDHYSVRLQTSEPCGPENDDCFVHSNSGIPNHAFYLAIEGGTNRVSGLSTQGVGGANREQIEKVFYRAFTLMLPATATFANARATTIQAARDLYGAGSAPERAVVQAWAAVGLQ